MVVVKSAGDTVAHRLSGIAAIVDGLLWLAGALVTLRFEPHYWAAYRFVDYLAVCMYSAALFLLGLGLVGIHAQQAGRAGRLELIGFVVAFIGAVMAGIGDFVEDALHFSSAGQALFFPGMLALGTGLALLGICTLIAKVFPRWYGGLLTLSPVVGFFLGGLWGNWPGTILFGLTWIALGGFLAIDQRQKISQKI
jgi:hypothetical protein